MLQKDNSNWEVTKIMLIFPVTSHKNFDCFSLNALISTSLKLVCIKVAIIGQHMLLSIIGSNRPVRLGITNGC